ncbi:class III lanthionine synthetase LanKC [Oenococcus sp.]|uniref:class III lanthionine synthetase LanKC n=1 Tax=Oenococcus sp. TaxID=1979414 RepID=UPI0039EA21BB
MYIPKFSDEAYLKYSQNKDNLFYSFSGTRKTQNAYDRFPIAHYEEENWENQSDDYWFYMNSKKNDFPSQGWKIHITATLEDAGKLLYDVSKLLISKNVSFKFAPNVGVLKQRNSKNADRGESGKFITIYPWDTDCFLQLLNQLKKITDIYSLGPYILNDKQWQGSNVFFRYGGLKRIQHEINGKKCLCIQTPDGVFVEDQRVPFYYLPNFITEPSFLVKNNIFPKKEIFKRIDSLHISEALHFSNSGGVYEITINGEKAILKEGRSQAGLDSNGQDGFIRIKNEHSILHRLSDLDSVVNVKQYFVTWYNNYFIEDFVDGENLHQFIARNFPFNEEDDVNGLTAKYSTLCQKILSDLTKSLTQIHNKGIAVGDLSLNNIMVSFGKENNLYQRLTLIDFETAYSSDSTFASSLVTPGFYSDKAKTALEGDWLALYKIARKLFLPINSVTDIAPKIKFVQDELIKEKFGKQTTDFLLTLENEISEHVSIFLGSPWISRQLEAPQSGITKDNVNFYEKKLADGIISNLHFDSKYLTSGDIGQFYTDSGNYNIAYGSFGVLLSLSRYFGKDFVSKNLKIKNWLDTILPKILSSSMKGTQDIGLFTGLSGIATSMYELGYEKEALLMIHTMSMDELSRTKDISIFSGYAGLGLLFLSFYNLLDSKEYLRKIVYIRDALMHLYEEESESNTLEANLGFMTGWLGVALFFWEFSLLFQDQHSSDVANAILKKSFRTLSPGQDIENQSYVLDDKNRLNPYLTNGSAGVALVMLEMIKDGGLSFNDYELSIFKELEQTNLSFCSYNGGLIDGYLGLLVLENGLNSTKLENNIGPHKAILKNLNHFIALDPSNNSFLFPGNNGFKFSMDLFTGAAGAMAVLNDINTNGWGSWFPVLMKNNKIFHYTEAQHA